MSTESRTSSPTTKDSILDVRFIPSKTIKGAIQAVVRYQPAEESMEVGGHEDVLNSINRERRWFRGSVIAGYGCILVAGIDATKKFVFTMGINAGLSEAAQAVGEVGTVGLAAYGLYRIWRGRERFLNATESRWREKTRQIPLDPSPQVSMAN